MRSQLSKQRYGLVWLDVPEEFEKESEDRIPILEEVPEKEIRTDDGKPYHILIEGENYHALTCLNYTHRGKVDVIYIDPPYNTGSDGFRYRDKRFLTEFPNGVPVPKDSPFRHSYWLSFMAKRLELAKNLLSDRGVIFISIDDNEQANLKLLCDQVFGEDNHITTLPRKGTGGRQDSKHFAVVHEYILCYAKCTTRYIAGRAEKEEGKFPYIDKDGNAFNTQLLRKWGDNSRRTDRPNLFYPIYFNRLTEQFSTMKIDESDIEIFPMLSKSEEGCWRWGKKTMQANMDSGLIELKKKNGEFIPYEKIYESDSRKSKPFVSWIDSINNSTGAALLKSILGEDLFSYPKPVDLIQLLIQMASAQKSSTILDFFAGSGTTLHAVMKLNEEDGGNRQCILVQLDENGICENVTYERNRRVIQGYENPKGEQVPGLGNSLKYYRTAFVGKNPPARALDADRIELACKAGYLLAMGENTLFEQTRTETFQIFADSTEKKRVTAIYFEMDIEGLDEFERQVKEYARTAEKVSAYLFSWSNGEEFESMFEEMPNIEVKSIPQPILEIYRTIQK